MSLKDIVEKLQKLMLKEESCRKIGNIEEAAVYAAKIAEWAIRYKVNVATLATEAEKERAEKGIGQDVVDATNSKGRRPILWHAKIARIVCEHTGCDYCMMSHSSRIIIVGKEVDRQLAVYLTKTLCEFIAKESQRQYDKEYYTLVEKQGLSSALLADYKSSWILGAIHTLTDRINEMEARVEAEIPAAGFALILRKDAEVSKQWLEQHIKPNKKSYSSKKISLNQKGYQQGAEAAAGVSLGPPTSTPTAPRTALR